MTHKASNFNPNHIFVDTNVLVGGYSGDARFQKDADCLRYLYSLTGNFKDYRLFFNIRVIKPERVRSISQ